MPLSQQDRKFLQTVDRFQVYLLVTAALVLVFLLLSPREEIRMTTAVIGFVLSAIFWLTHRLLAYASMLDVELMQVTNALKRALPEEQR